ncbi:hypothetical protein HMPREF9587_00074 [Cutibacterium acnes HL025PA1]|nr:hypothetical protein HMPREF9587_00074 [Cutibacterium acnes HL025PA1]
MNLSRDLIDVVLISCGLLVFGDRACGACGWAINADREVSIGLSAALQVNS